MGESHPLDDLDKKFEEQASSPSQDEEAQSNHHQYDTASKDDSLEAEDESSANKNKKMSNKLGFLKSRKLIVVPFALIGVAVLVKGVTSYTSNVSAGPSNTPSSKNNNAVFLGLKDDVESLKGLESTTADLTKKVNNTDSKIRAIEHQLKVLIQRKQGVSEVDVRKILSQQKSIQKKVSDFEDKQKLSVKKMNEHLASVVAKYDYKTNNIISRVDNLRDDLSKLESDNIKINSEKIKRTRLKGFNIVNKVVDNVYAIRAPDKKNGEENYITLKINESFVDYKGHHKVTGIQGEGEKVRYLVDDKYFIDLTREKYKTPHYSVSSSDHSRPKRASKSNKSLPLEKASKSDQPLPIEKAFASDPESNEFNGNNDENKSNERVSRQDKQENTQGQDVAMVQQYKDGKILLPNFKIIMQSPNLQSALVVDQEKGGKPIELRLNQYNSFFGEVKSISPDSICSDQFCIGNKIDG